MIRMIRRLAIVGVVGLAVLALSTSSADAYWWRCGPPVSCCYGPCWTGCDPCGTGWVLGWRPGPIRRLLFGRYRWYPVAVGCVGGWASWTCEPCCTEVATVAPVTATPEAAQPTIAPKVQTPPTVSPSNKVDEEIDRMMRERPSPVPAKKPAESSTLEPSARGSSGLLSVTVPAGAKVYINGRETQSVGSRREYVSFGLQEGKLYPYTVRALVLARDNPVAMQSRDQRWVWITKTVYLRAGDRVSLSFSDNLELESQLAQVEPAGIR